MTKTETQNRTSEAENITTTITKTIVQTKTVIARHEANSPSATITTIHTETTVTRVQPNKPTKITTTVQTKTITVSIPSDTIAVADNVLSVSPTTPISPIITNTSTSYEPDRHLTQTDDKPGGKRSRIFSEFVRHSGKQLVFNTDSTYPNRRVKKKNEFPRHHLTTN